MLSTALLVPNPAATAMNKTPTVSELRPVSRTTIRSAVSNANPPGRPSNHVNPRTAGPSATGSSRTTDTNDEITVPMASHIGAPPKCTNPPAPC